MIDTGPGIAPNDLQRIFDPFVQLKSLNSKPGGTGLGLAVSIELARLLGGDITVTSELGVGSRFSTVIPR
jgi:signal transduction histidine kinase